MLRRIRVNKDLTCSAIGITNFSQGVEYLKFTFGETDLISSIIKMHGHRSKDPTMEVEWLTIESISRGRLMTSNGCKFNFLISGSCEYAVKNDTIVVEKGDSLTLTLQHHPWPQTRQGGQGVVNTFYLPEKYACENDVNQEVVGRMNYCIFMSKTSEQSSLELKIGNLKPIPCGQIFIHTATTATAKVRCRII
jgi:hypothetical protein